MKKTQQTTNENRTQRQASSVNLREGASQTQVATSGVGADVQPFVDRAVVENQNLFEFLSNLQNPDFSTVVRAAPETEASLRSIRDRVNAGQPLIDQAASTASEIARSSGVSPNIVSAITGQAVNPTANQAIDLLTPTARGDFLDPTTDPNLGRLIDDAITRSSDAVNNAFSRRGRFGSGANQEVLAEEAGNIASRILLDNRNAERNRQLAASNAIGSFSAGDSARSLEAANLASLVGGRDASTRLAAAGALPGLEEAGFLGADRLAGVGERREEQSRREIEDALSRFNFNIANQINANAGLQGGLATLSPLLERTQTGASTSEGDRSVDSLANLVGQASSTTTSRENAFNLQNIIAGGLLAASLF